MCNKPDTELGVARSTARSPLGYGASTKGNVLLQLCGIKTQQVAAIANRRRASIQRSGAASTFL